MNRKLVNKGIFFFLIFSLYFYVGCSQTPSPEWLKSKHNDFENVTQHLLASPDSYTNRSKPEDLINHIPKIKSKIKGFQSYNLFAVEVFTLKSGYRAVAYCFGSNGWESENITFFLYVENELDSDDFFGYEQFIDFQVEFDSLSPNWGISQVHRFKE